MTSAELSKVVGCTVTLYAMDLVSPLKPHSKGIKHLHEGVLGNLLQLYSLTAPYHPWRIADLKWLQQAFSQGDVQLPENYLQQPYQFTLPYLAEIYDHENI